MSTPTIAPPTRQYLPFADWLKTLGLALIVYGHVAPSIGIRAVAPVYHKQIGVAFFVFVTGFTLARERRTTWRVVYDRLFDLCAIGFVFALLMSVVGMLLWHDPNESNYLPFAAGLNVFVNNFPANPTTWYIGTYCHLLLLWALVLRKVRVTIPVILGAAVVECLVRAVLVHLAGGFVAYMFVGNWITVLTLGLWSGGLPASPVQRWQNTAPVSGGEVGLTTAATAARRRNDDTRAWLGAIAALAWIAVWPQLMHLVAWQLTFPLMSLRGDHWSGVLAASAATSVVYISYTLAGFVLACMLPSSAFAKYFARGTILVVIVHMPVYYLLEWVLRPRLTDGPRMLLEFLVCFVGLTLIANVLLPYLDLKRRREQCAGALERVGSRKLAFGSRL
jgi:hypothetical protein